MLEVCEVRSSFLKLMMMITHIKLMQIPYLDIWSMIYYLLLISQQVPHTSYSGHFFEMFKDML